MLVESASYVVIGRRELLGREELSLRDHVLVGILGVVVAEGGAQRGRCVFGSHRVRETHERLAQRRGRAISWIVELGAQELRGGPDVELRPGPVDQARRSQRLDELLWRNRAEVLEIGSDDFGQPAGGLAGETL